MAPPMDDLGGQERRFDAAMRNIYAEAARLGYRPTRFLEMVSEHGGVETAHRLLATDKRYSRSAEPACGDPRSASRAPLVELQERQRTAQLPMLKGGPPAASATT
jgi:hypothetical protein